MTTINIKGDIVDVIREKGKTEVIVDAGMGQEVYPLNEGLISFGAAIKDRQYDKAVDILETMSISPETEAMWSSLAVLSMQDRKLHIAERCYAAIGDVSRARYLHKINHKIMKAKMQSASGAPALDENGQPINPDEASSSSNALGTSLAGVDAGPASMSVEIKLDILEKQFKKAEYTLLHHGRVDEAISMYNKLHKYDEAIAVAEAKNRPEAEDLRNNYFQWLLGSGQEEKAAKLKEKEGDFYGAIDLYLRGGLPSRAAQLVVDQGLTHDEAGLEKIAGELFKAQLFEKAGDFFEKLSMHERALDAYRRGRAYRPAVELSRKFFPDRVVPLEAEWADYLVSQQQLDSAVHHYLECGNYISAIETAIDARQWGPAIQIVEKLDPEQGSQYFSRIAKHYEEVMNVELAESYYVKAGNHREAVDMYLRHNMWDKAHRVAVKFMSNEEVCMLYINQATRLEGQGRLAEAEKLLITVNEVDLAINMYKKARQFDDMVRLVTVYHKDLLVETNKSLASQLEEEGNLKLAEKYYVASGNWKSAVSMYRQKELWEDAMRVARSSGGVKAAGQVCWVFAKSQKTPDAGCATLIKYGFPDLAIRFAYENKSFAKAEQLAREYNKSKLPEIFLNHASCLEEEGKYAEAEDEFIRAEQPREAVLMYCHLKDWVNAGRVAQNFCPDAVADIFEQQGVSAQEARDFNKAEQLYIKAKKPQLAVDMYVKANMPDHAMRVRKDHMYNEAGRGEAFDTAAQAKSNNQNIELLLRRAEQDPQFYTEAVKMAKEQSMPVGRFEDLINFVVSKLNELARFEQLARILLNYADRVKEAIDALVEGGLFKDAYELAQTKMQQALPSIKRSHIQWAASHGEWDQCLDLAVKEGTDVGAKFAAEFVKEKLESGMLDEACEVFLKYGIMPIPANVPVYHALAQSVLAEPYTEEIPKSVSLLKEVLLRVIADMGSQAVDFTQSSIEDFEKLAFIVHVFNQYYECTKASLPAQRARAATSLLRYFGAIPADKAYFIAGIAQRDSNGPMAFMFLNRYLDITEALEEGEETIANDGFENTDLSEVLPVPHNQFLTEQKREEIRNWLLQQVSEGDTMASRHLSVRPCENCGSEIYEASLWCYQCKHINEPCIVTGYPVLASTKVQCRSCQRSANKEDWNKFVMAKKSCPWCGDPQGPIW